MCVSLNHVRKVTMQKLCQEWDRLTFQPREDVDEFALRL
jgi:hypothetical protein